MTLTRISSFLKHSSHSFIPPPLQAWNAMCRRSGSGSQQRDLWSRCGLQCQDWRYGQIKTSSWLIWSHRLQTWVSSQFSFLTARIAVYSTLSCSASVIFSPFPRHSMPLNLFEHHQRCGLPMCCKCIGFAWSNHIEKAQWYAVSKMTRCCSFQRICVNFVLNLQFTACTQVQQKWLIQRTCNTHPL